MTVCPSKTRADLEWDRLLSALADRTMSVVGRELAANLPFPDSHEESMRCRQESMEASSLHRNGEPLPGLDVPDTRAAVDRLRIGASLGPLELRDIARMLVAARALRRFLNLRKSRIPTLFDTCATDPSLDSVADEMHQAFDPDGTLSDEASPKLRELRGEYQSARQRMLSRLDELMRKYESIVQDRYVTEREGRYVVPIRSDAHERFPGLVHATSASGATLFVEPRAVIPMGNRLKMLEAEVRREEEAVYSRLSGRLMDHVESIAGACSALAWADVRRAVAQLGEDLAMVFPDASSEARIELVQGRHPLLLLDLPKVVASDVSILGGRAMVVSGPNAGGKTVALKLLGLAALMVRAGLPVPCKEGSIVGFFDIVLTDVGDDQSLQKNLSTFSAHVRNLVSVLEETRPGALVLLDELAGGTDPREGEALAAGVLDSLCARGGAVAVTTHYEGLKALALADERFVNASVGFDIERMVPTYALAMGIPGSSSALAVARQYGMPSTVIGRAQRFLSREDQNFEQVVQKLHDERAALELARQATTTRLEELNEARAQVEEELAQLRNREKLVLSREAGEVMVRLQRAKEDLRAAQNKLRTKRLDDAQMREAEKAVARVAGRVALGGDLETVVAPRTDDVRNPMRPESLRKGVRVYVSRLRAEAEVVELLGGGQVRVAAGALKLTVGVEDLQTPAAVEIAKKAPAKGHTSSRRGPEAPLEVAIQTSENSVDLRGMRTDDAVSLATSFLDRSLHESRRVAFLIHGHGTGALRDALRKELQENRYVAYFRAGESGEGGDGVTVVWLA